MSQTREDALPRNPWWLRRPEVLVYGALAVSVTAALVELIRIVIGGGGFLPMLGVLLTVSGSLLARRSWCAGLALALVGCAVTPLGGWNPITEWTMVVFTLFAATLTGAPVVRSLALVAVPLYAIVGIEADSGMTSPDVLAAVAASIAGAAVGAGLRSQQQYWAALREHAREAIATREAEAARRVGQERLRIARDLHDVVGHQVAVASMHLGAVEVTLRTDPDTAARSAADARTALHTVTTETQQILQLLRTQDGRAEVDHSVANLASLNALVDSFERIGLRVDAVLPENVPVGVHPGVELTAFRVVQEALTNAHRYGDDAAAVRVQLLGQRVEITVKNRTRFDAAEQGGSGFGLIGMRERVAASGGILEVENQPGREFVVHAALALDGRKLR